MNLKNLNPWNKNKNIEERSLNDSDPIYGNGGFSYSGLQQGVKVNSTNALNLSAVYSCVNLISNAVASLNLCIYSKNERGFQIKVVDDKLAQLLDLEPNENMSRYIFMKEMIQYLLLRGNAYVYIERDSKFNIISLQLIDPSFVVPLMIQNQLKFFVTSLNLTLDNSQCIHLMLYPYTIMATGITMGKSVIQHAGESLQIVKYAENTAYTYFSGGANTNLILNSVAPLDKKQREAIIEGLKSSSSQDSKTPSGISIISGKEFKQIPIGVTPKDSQMIESRKFGISEISRWFRVNPILLYDLDNSKISTAENSQLQFINETLISYLTLIENELNRKLLLPSERSKKSIKFNLQNLLRGDSSSRADYYTKMFGIGVYSPNDIARELDLEEIAGGDKHFVPVNVQDLENIIYNPDVKMPIDNKAKTIDAPKIL